MRTPGTESNVKEIYDKLRRAGARSGERDRQSVQRVRELPRPLALHRPGARARLRSARRQPRPACRLAGFVAASGSSGTLGAGDYLKEKYGARIAAVEAVECPTLLNNGYGEHNIQGIGDKHVPLIHNVMNTDFVIGVSDQATDGLNAVFNTAAGRAYLQRRTGVSAELLGMLQWFGLSSLCNLLAAIKLAQAPATSAPTTWW